MRPRLNRWIVALLAVAICAPVGAIHAAGPPHSIVLPPVLVAEAPATLAVLDSTGHLVPGAGVALSDGRAIKTDATGRARFVVPGRAGELSAQIPGGSIAATAPIEVRPPAAEIQVTDFPAVIDARDQFTISGARFAGDADGNQVSVGGKAALVLAASPAALVLLPAPDTPLGPGELRVEGNGTAPAPMAVTVVSVEAINPAGPLRIGVAATLIVRVSGTNQPLDLDLGNWTPGVIKMLGQAGGAAAGGAAQSDPNVRRVRSSGGAENEARIEIVPLAAGKFYVRARLAGRRP
jgi:hypothetical protein